MRRVHKWWTALIFARVWAGMAEGPDKEAHRRFIEAWLDGKATRLRGRLRGERVAG